MNACMRERKDGQKHAQTSRQTDGQTDQQVHVWKFLCSQEKLFLGAIGAIPGSGIPNAPPKRTDKLRLIVWM